jgi:hypothetical protein
MESIPKRAYFSDIFHLSVRLLPGYQPTAMLFSGYI